MFVNELRRMHSCDRVERVLPLGLLQILHLTRKVPASFVARALLSCRRQG